LKVFVVGGTGLFGYHSINKFLQEDIEVKTIALPPLPTEDLFDEDKVELELNNLWEYRDEEIRKKLEGSDWLLYTSGKDERYLPDQPAIYFYRHFNVDPLKRLLPLAKKAGIRLKFEDVKALVAEGGSIGRPHIARAITNAGGVNNVMEAYAKYINDASNVYVQRKTVSPHEACEIIYEAGGIPVFAHPIDVEISDELTKELISYGLRGIEAYHRKHSPAVVEHYSTLAEKYGLIITGGSDFHAPSVNHGSILMGKNFVPSWVYDELIKEKRRLELL